MGFRSGPAPCPAPLWSRLGPDARLFSAGFHGRFLVSGRRRSPAAGPAVFAPRNAARRPTPRRRDAAAGADEADRRTLRRLPLRSVARRATQPQWVGADASNARRTIRPPAAPRAAAPRRRHNGPVPRPPAAGAATVAASSKGRHRRRFAPGSGWPASRSGGSSRSRSATRAAKNGE